MLFEMFAADVFTKLGRIRKALRTKLTNYILSSSMHGFDVVQHHISGRHFFQANSAAKISGLWLRLDAVFQLLVIKLGDYGKAFLGSFGRLGLQDFVDLVFFFVFPGYVDRPMH